MCRNQGSDRNAFYLLPMIAMLPLVNKNTVVNTVHEDVQELEWYATKHYMLGSVKVFPLCCHDFVVKIIENFTLSRIKIVHKIHVGYHEQNVLKHDKLFVKQWFAFVKWFHSTLVPIPVVLFDDNML